MTEVYTYIKKRGDMQKQVNFKDTTSDMRIASLPNPETDQISKTFHIKKNPNTIVLSNFPEKTE